MSNEKRTEEEPVLFEHALECVFRRKLHMNNKCTCREEDSVLWCEAKFNGQGDE